MSELEPILICDRISIFPILEDEIWQLVKQLQSSTWFTAEIDFSTDVRDWVIMTDNEKHFIKSILAFFANADALVNDNLILNFFQEIKLPESKMFFATQIFNEVIHQETYSLTIDTLIKDKKEKELLFNAIRQIPFVQKKASFVTKWMEKDDNDINRSLARRLVAFICVEGLLFSASFCALFWLKTKNKLHGVTFSNELISRDESLHCKHLSLLHSKLIYNKTGKKDAEEIIREAVDIEMEFVKESLNVDLIGMNSKLMCEYVQFVADYLLIMIGYEKIYHTTNPFKFIEAISIEGKTNFFERRVSEYSKNLGNEEDNKVSFEEDF